MACKLSDLSSEVQHLTGIVKDRYVDKLNELGIRDPYSTPQSLFVKLTPTLEEAQVPDIHYMDLCNFLLDK